eukprot:Pgem_evm1s7832
MTPVPKESLSPKLGKDIPKKDPIYTSPNVNSITYNLDSSPTRSDAERLINDPNFISFVQEWKKNNPQADFENPVTHNIIGTSYINKLRSSQTRSASPARSPNVYSSPARPNLSGNLNLNLKLNRKN